MVDDLKKNFQNITFDQVPRVQNKAVNAMATIGSLIVMESDSPKYKFLIEHLLQPDFETSHANMVCNIFYPNHLGIMTFMFILKLIPFHLTYPEMTIAILFVDVPDLQL